MRLWAAAVLNWPTAIGTGLLRIVLETVLASCLLEAPGPPAALLGQHVCSKSHWEE